MLPTSSSNALDQLVHLILSLFGTGATPSQLQQGYDHNTGYQRPAKPAREQVVRELQTWDRASAYLGRGQHYQDFLAFFQREIGARGWEAVLAEHLLAGTPSADDLLVRLYAGIMHPLIQLMYGMEWRQPAIVAEALAQACVHGPDYGDLLLQAERDANERYPGQGLMPSIVSLLDEAGSDPKLSKAVHVDDDAKIRDGLLRRAPEETRRILSKVKVRPEELEERTAEMFDAALYTAASATFHAEKTNKFDFFLM